MMNSTHVKWLPEHTITNALITGDAHGSTDRFTYLFKKLGKEIMKHTAILILGDAGFDYYLNKTDRKKKQQLQETGAIYYLVRGNHEQRPELVDDIEMGWDNYVDNYVYFHPDFLNIRYLIDGLTYNYDGYRCLVIGGAYSVDKEYRLSRGAPYYWFEGEQLTPKERERISGIVDHDMLCGAGYDFIFSHTCPLKFVPTDLFLAQVNQDTVDKSMEVWLDEIEEKADYTCWCFGHYHENRWEPMRYNASLGEWIIPRARQLFTDVVDINKIYKEAKRLKEIEENDKENDV